MIPDISIVTIVYNGLPYLKECIASVLKQQHQNWELLISDDGSTDGSIQFLDELSDPRITLFKQPKNLGIFDNLNFLLQNAKSSITQILCQDDYFTTPESLQSILNYWKTAGLETGFVRFNHRQKNVKRLEAFQYEFLPPLIRAGDADILFYIFGNIPGNLSNISLRTDLTTTCGKFEQSYPYAGDMEFWTRAARQVDMGISSEQVVFIREHNGQASKYLNYKGELIAQKAEIINLLYKNLIIRYPSHSFALKLHGTLQYDSLQRDLAVKSLLAGNYQHLRELNLIRSKTRYTFASIHQWIIFFISIGGRLGRLTTGKYLLNKLNIKFHNTLAK